MTCDYTLPIIIAIVGTLGFVVGAFFLAAAIARRAQ